MLQLCNIPPSPPVCSVYIFKIINWVVMVPFYIAKMHDYQMLFMYLIAFYKLRNLLFSIWRKNAWLSNVIYVFDWLLQTI